MGLSPKQKKYFIASMAVILISGIYLYVVQELYYTKPNLFYILLAIDALVCYSVFTNLTKEKEEED